MLKKIINIDLVILFVCDALFLLVAGIFSTFVYNLIVVDYLKVELLPQLRDLTFVYVANLVFLYLFTIRSGKYKIHPIRVIMVLLTSNIINYLISYKLAKFENCVNVMPMFMLISTIAIIFFRMHSNKILNNIKKIYLLIPASPLKKYIFLYIISLALSAYFAIVGHTKSHKGMPIISFFILVVGVIEELYSILKDNRNYKS